MLLSASLPYYFSILVHEELCPYNLLLSGRMLVLPWSSVNGVLMMKQITYYCIGTYQLSDGLVV